MSVAIAIPPTVSETTYDIDADIDAACARIAPLWPLRNFVAVNPFLGFSGQSFAATVATLRRTAGADMLMPRAFYRKAKDEGLIEEIDLRAAQTARAADPLPVAGGSVVTVAETLDRLAGGDRQVAGTAFMIDEISKFCAAYFDEGQSVWRLPSRGLPLYAAWREMAKYDRNPEAMGVKGFRASVQAMPADPREAIAAAVKALRIPEAAVTDHLYRALFDIGGWAAYVRRLDWSAASQSHEALAQLLAIRVVWGYALFRERSDSAFVTAWAKGLKAAAAPRSPASDPELAEDLVWHEAYENGFLRRLLSQWRASETSAAPNVRAPVQAAFCIDVRSEIFRRALETAMPEAETIGFAGFFGFPIEYVPIGARQGRAQCPVLLKPAFTVCEEVAGADKEEARSILGLRLARRRAAKAWKAFKLSAISGFAFVETAGLAFAVKIVGDALGLTRPVADPLTEGFDAAARARLGPRIEAEEIDGRPTGFNEAQRVAMAEAVLRALSLTSNFAPLVLLAGHGATSANNPHATSLDCGACGGHSGEANARVAAAILNDAATRRGLAAKGIVIPDDTWFLAALHDTTTDEVTLFDTAHAPASHAARLAQLKSALAAAGAGARAERAARLGVEAGAQQKLKARARDWSEVRPEWGLARNAVFIAAPRKATRRLDLGGRAFLHSYDWRIDDGFKTLDLILTAPMVVGSWINLQYFGSTTNNAAFGAGDKTLHNVVGAIGVLEGSAGDLKTGLPLQSVHDGARCVHEPLRLSVFVAAPTGAIDHVIAERQSVRELVDNGWVHLFALGDDGLPSARYRRASAWEPLR